MLKGEGGCVGGLSEQTKGKINIRIKTKEEDGRVKEKGDKT